jgi:hypothetical protein
MANTDRLFVPLTKEAYKDFLERGKEYEVRVHKSQYGPKYVYSGRAVELRKGYSGESVWGIVGEVVAGSLEEIFSEVELARIEPMANSIDEAIGMNRQLLGSAEEYVAFQVVLSNTYEEKICFK